MSAAAPPGEKTCGDFGGKKASGEDCGRQAGWGTDHLGEGRCKDHGDAKARKIEETKRAFLELYRRAGGSKGLRACAKAVGVGPTTVWEWRQRDPEFDRQVEEAVEALDEIRLANVEDSAYARILKGEASASLEIFWIVNVSRRLAKRKGGDPRWEDLKRLNVDLDGKLDVAEIPYERRMAAVRALAGGSAGDPGDEAGDAG